MLIVVIMAVIVVIVVADSEISSPLENSPGEATSL